jgi:hypothetical protein
MSCATAMVFGVAVREPSPRRLSPRRAQSGRRTQPESQGSASLGTDVVPPRGEGALVVSKVDPLYLFACALEWRASCRGEAFWELLSALTSADAGTRLVAEALLRKCQCVLSGFKKQQISSVRARLEETCKAAGCNEHDATDGNSRNRAAIFAVSHGDRSAESAWQEFRN